MKTKHRNTWKIGNECRSVVRESSAATTTFKRQVVKMLLWEKAPLVLSIFVRAFIPTKAVKSGSHPSRKCTMSDRDSAVSISILRVVC